MKRFTKAILIWALALSLAVTTAGTGFAETQPAEPAQEQAQEQEQNQMPEIKPEPQVEILTAQRESGRIKLLNVKETPDGVKKCRFSLASYLMMATGEPLNPKPENIYYTDEKGTIVKPNPWDYKVEYFRIVSSRHAWEEESRPVKDVLTPGEYRIVVSTKEGQYRGSALFTVLGKRQFVTAEKTYYKLSEMEQGFNILPAATGDGTGFSYVSSDPKVVKVSSKGWVTVKGKGTAVITVSTVGDKVYHTGKLEVRIRVVAEKKDKGPERKETSKSPKA